ncbi:MAG: DNA gyrase subunit A [Oscillospiraceae bacterium]|nr:DNA gyrase subunit A [Oscillospiraceae bacterium]
MELDSVKLHPDEKLVQVDIEKEMKTSFLEYSMSVIVARALPDVRDGLKPVHRRILYTQFEEGLTHDKPFSKCAKTVGAVLGSYHPHGDQSVYDALVRMTQDFSLRYPLIEGHGNFGSIGGDAPAAYRYTESRLARISAEMLADINKDTVDYTPNYDESRKEPVVLPCRFPNLLVNGSTGIAVGMATNIPPHNLSEIIDALQLILLSDEEIPIDMLMSVIKGPDFPTGGVIMGHAGIRSAYYTGRGKITLRGKAEIVEEKTHTRIVITEIPYMVGLDKLFASLQTLAKENRLDGVSVVRDESDRNGMKVVVELKRDANASVVLSKLYSYTQLQDTFSVIMLALVDGQPRVLNLKQMLEHYIEFQEQVVTRRTQFDLKKAQARAHVLEGFMLVINHIDEVIAIIRSSDDPAQAKARLIERFGITEIQSEAIAQMRIIQLTKLGRIDIEEELGALNAKITELSGILADRKIVRKIVSDELNVIRERFCAKDSRRTSIESVSGEVDIEDLIPVEESVLTYTNIGYIKRQPTESYNLQRRGGRGVSGMKQRDEDFVESLFIASSHDFILFVTNLGNMYRLKCYEIPEGSKQSRGTNIVNILQLQPQERITAMLKAKPSDFTEDRYFMCVTKNGLIKRSKLSLFKNVRKRGVRAITLLEGDEIVAAHLTEGDSSVIIATRNGRALRFNESVIRAKGRNSRGIRGIKFRNDYSEADYVVGAAKVYDENSTILTVTERGFGRRSEVSRYIVKSRGGMGQINYKPDDERGYVCGIRTLFEDDDIIFINDEGVIIRIRANDLRAMSRTGKGVRVMRLSENGRVVAFTRTEHDDSAELEEVEQVDEAEILAAEAEERAEVVEIEELDEEVIDDDDDSEAESDESEE